MERLVRRSYLVSENDSGRRIDRIVRKMFPSLSLSAVYRMIRKGSIRVSGKKIACGARANEGEEILVEMESIPADLDRSMHKAVHGSARDIRRIVVYENSALLALNKPRGMLVHGCGSADELVRAYLGESLPASLSFTPGPVHRLDRNTTGLLVFAKTLASAQALSSMFRARMCRKYYICAFSGIIRNACTWADSLVRDESSRKTLRGRGGARAITNVYPVTNIDAATLAVCEISSGRTHQIRSQAAIHGHPLSGDSKYGGAGRRRGYILHSAGMLLAEDRAVGVLRLFAGIPSESFEYLKKTFGDWGVTRAIRRVEAFIGRKEK
jgi:23S rRNA pseudouridine955/2504/2580 synthase